MPVGKTGQAGSRCDQSLHLVLGCAERRPERHDLRFEAFDSLRLQSRGRLERTNFSISRIERRR